MGRWWAGFLAGWALWGQEAPSPNQLLEKTIYAARDRYTKMSNVACKATIERRRCIRSRPELAVCSLCPGDPGRLLAQSDRIHVEVGLSKSGELFSWPGDGAFQVGELSTLIGGGTAAVGEFASFPLVILLTDARAGQVYFDGQRFEFQVSAAESHYAIRGMAASDVITPYEAWMTLTEDGSIRRLEVKVTRPPEQTGLAKIETEIDYEGLIPSLAQTRFYWPDGTVTSSKTTYSSCREFQSTSQISFDDETPKPKAEAPLTPLALREGQDVAIALVTAIDSESSVTGDRVEGRLKSALRGPDGKVVAAKGTQVFGRLARLEHLYCAKSNYYLGLEFTAIAVGDQRVPIALRPTPYSSPGRTLPGGGWSNDGLVQIVVPGETRIGVQNYFFPGERVKVKPGLETKWIVGRP